MDDEAAVRMKYQELKDMIEKIGYPSVILRGELSEYEKIAAEHGEEAAMLFLDKPKPITMPDYTIDYISKMHDDKYHEICIGFELREQKQRMKPMFSDTYSIKKCEHSVIKIGGV